MYFHETLILSTSLSHSFDREQYDVVFELASMLFNIGIWYMKHAGKIAGREEYVTFFRKLQMMNIVHSWMEHVRF